VLIYHEWTGDDGSIAVAYDLTGSYDKFTSVQKVICRHRWFYGWCNIVDL